jgi:dTDP-4-dehydrorhamnose 3,5-epimerase
MIGLALRSLGMPFELESAHINGDVIVIKPTVFGDERGFFMETYRQDNFRDLGLPTEWLQDNHSRSSRGVLRGLHFQWDRPMSKIMRVTRGAAFLVAVDIRKNSPTLGKWFGTEVTAENKRQIFAPYGFARGFCALTDDCEVQYKCTAIYNPQAESGILYKDPEIGISWPVARAQLSAKDATAQTLRQWLASPTSEKVAYRPKSS